MFIHSMMNTNQYDEIYKMKKHIQSFYLIQQLDKNLYTVLQDVVLKNEVTEMEYQHITQLTLKEYNQILLHFEYDEKRLNLIISTEVEHEYAHDFRHHNSVIFRTFKTMVL